MENHSPQTSLELFVKLWEELLKSSLVQTNSLRSEWSLSYVENSPATYRLIQPDEDSLKAYLMTFRKFISQGEPAHITRIFKLCLLHFTDIELLRQIRRCEDGWKRDVRKNTTRFVFEGREIAPERLADLWVNGSYFHNDREKSEERERLEAASYGLARHEFITYIRAATIVIAATGHTINMAISCGTIDYRKEKNRPIASPS